MANGIIIIDKPAGWTKLSKKALPFFDKICSLLRA